MRPITAALGIQMAQQADEDELSAQWPLCAEQVLVEGREAVRSERTIREDAHVVSEVRAAIPLTCTSRPPVVVE